MPNRHEFQTLPAETIFGFCDVNRGLAVVPPEIEETRNSRSKIRCSTGLEACRAIGEDVLFDLGHADHDRAAASGPAPVRFHHDAEWEPILRRYPTLFGTPAAPAEPDASS